jgi:hypothetical protein
MSETLRRVQTLVLADDYYVSDHAYEQLDDDDIIPTDVIEGIASAFAIEDYPDRARGPSVLVLQQDEKRKPLHAIWALPAGQRRPAVLVTAYRPDPTKWDNDFKRRTKP